MNSCNTRTAVTSIFTFLTFLFLGQAAFSETRAAPSATCSYIFRYATGLSKVLMDTLTFVETQPLKLGECETTEKTNGPLACATNCQGVPLCLLVFEGPPGLKSTDVLEKLKEKPVIHSAENSGNSGITPSTPSPEPSRSERIELYRQY